jgi:hypothetical protein
MREEGGAGERRPSTMLGDFVAEATSKSARFLGLNFFDLGQFNPDSAAHKQQRKGNSSLKNQ